MFKHPEGYDFTNVEEPITEEQVKTWVAKLRSGDFKQSKGSLTSPDGYCCLGVLASDELDGKKFRDSKTGNGAECSYYKKFDEGGVRGEVQTAVYLPSNLQGVYWRMNDTQGKSFNEIADQIEKDFGLA